MRYSVHSSGRQTASVGLPGTGLGYQESWKAGSAGAASSQKVAPAPKPGLFAPAHEKAFHKAVQTYAAGGLHGAIALFRAAAEKDSSNRAASDDLFAGLLSVEAGDQGAAVPFLEKVVGSDHELPDELMAKYLEDAAIRLKVTNNVSVTVPFGSLAAALVLAECYRADGRTEDAMGLLQQLHAVDAGPVIALDMCSTLLAEQSYDEVVELACWYHQHRRCQRRAVRAVRARARREGSQRGRAHRLQRGAALKEAQYRDPHRRPLRPRHHVRTPRQARTGAQGP
jgi:tetratricopeptide (TPR) repeat protein